MLSLESTIQTRTRNFCCHRPFVKNICICYYLQHLALLLQLPSSLPFNPEHTQQLINAGVETTVPTAIKILEKRPEPEAIRIDDNQWS
jgi:hypothetical protein